MWHIPTVIDRRRSELPKARYIVAVVVVVALGAVIALVSQREETTAQSPSPKATRSSAETHSRNFQPNEGNFEQGSRQSSVTPPIQSAVPLPEAHLPPPNTKVRDVVAQLKADADRGEPHAACRLGAELTRCWQVQQRLAMRNSALSRSDSKLQDSASAADQDLCDGVTGSETGDAWRYLLTAALAGSGPAMSQFLVSPPLAAQDGSADGWSAYRQHYQDFLDRSIQRGDVRALYAGFFAAETGMGPGGRGVRGKDPYQSLVYGLALLPLVDTRTSQQIQAVLPNLMAQVPDPSTASQEATLLGSRYFGGRTPENVGSALGAVRPEACSD